MERLKKFLSLLIAAAVFAACFLMLLLPLPRTLATASAVYSCRWADGTITEESYADALTALAGIGEDGNLRLSRNGKVGIVVTDAAMKSAHQTLLYGSFLELLTLDVSGLDRLGHTALYREHAKTVYYAGEAFCFNGTSVVPSQPSAAERVVLLSGNLPAHYLSDVGASRLHLQAGAEIAASDLIGSKIQTVAAESPYTIEGGAIYRDTTGGRRLVAALPMLTELVAEACDFVDRGALLACTRLEKLTVPFAGSSASGNLELQFAWLYQTSNAYTMPETLTSVTVTGGYLTSYAFYACPRISEIDVCKVAPENIEAQAFLGASDLRHLHTPRADIVLYGDFTSYIADCGCTVYEKVGA